MRRALVLPAVVTGTVKLSFPMRFYVTECKAFDLYTLVKYSTPLGGYTTLNVCNVSHVVLCYRPLPSCPPPPLTVVFVEGPCGCDLHVGHSSVCGQIVRNSVRFNPPIDGVDFY
jgi:hypothetical protein